MFKRYRLNRLRIKLASLYGKGTAMEKVMRGSTYPAFFMSDICSINGKIKATEEKIQILKEQLNES